MADILIPVRIKELPLDNAPLASDRVAIDGASTRGATLESLVNSVAPVASQAEMIAAVDNEKRATPSGVRAAIDDRVPEIAVPLSRIIDTDVGLTGGGNLSGDLLLGFDVAFGDARYQTRDEKGEPDGYASLDATGKVPPSQLPDPLPPTILDCMQPSTGRAAVKARDTTENTLTFLDEGGRSGIFMWRNGNYAAEVAIDVLEGVYIKANAVPATSGAWVRQFGNMPIDPRWWGAIGDLSIDCSPAMAAAMIFAAGRRIHVPVGQWRIDSALSSSSPVYITGDGNGAGPGAAAQSNDNCTQFLLNYANPILFSIATQFPCIFENFQINVNPTYRPAAAGAGIVRYGAGGGNFANDRIKNVSFNQLYRGLVLFDASWLIVDGCYFDGWVEDAIYSSSTGIETAAGQIINNYFFGKVDGSQHSCITLRNGYTIISHNEIVGARIGVYLEGAVYPQGFQWVNDNTIEEQYHYGILAESTDPTLLNGSSAMVDLSRNEFSNLFTGATYRAAISINDRPDGQKWLTSLKIIGLTTRINCAPGVGAAHIRVGAGVDVKVHQCQLQELSGTSPFGIVVSGVSTNNCLGGDLSVINNSFNGTFSTRYSVIPECTVIEQHSGSATLNFGTIAAGGFADANIPVTGAVAGMAVALGIPGTLFTFLGLDVKAIASTNTVLVRIENRAGSAQNIGNQIFKAIVG